MSDTDIVKRRILERVPLADLLAEKIAITSRAGHKVACCPFHPEKTPSFYIYDDHYHCYGCQKHGDAIEYVRHEQGLGFVEALKFLAEKYGIEVPELNRRGDEYQRHSNEAVYYKAMMEAQQYFAANLAGPAGAAGREYLESRGFNPEKIVEYRFGLSLDDIGDLARRLTKSGFKPDDLTTCSLIDRSQRSNNYYDFFRNRVMVPICDGHGRIIAFGGRTMGDDKSKYKNSRETPIFDKKSVLFGLHAARESMRGSGRGLGHAIIVEGYMDTLQLWNYGFTQAVACMGTALGAAHLRQIAQITRQIYLIFDGDGAGRQANLRTVKSALQVSGLTIKVVLLPNGTDPDTFLRAHGAEALRELMTGSRDLLDHAITTTLADTQGLAVADLIEKDFVPWLRSVDNRVNYTFLATRLAQLTGIPFAMIDRLVEDQSVMRPAPVTAPARAGAMGSPLEPQAESAPWVMPSFCSPQFELLGHLYYAKPGEVDAVVARHLMNHEMELDEPLMALGLRMLDCLTQNQASPCSQPDPSWLLGLHPQTFDIIDKFKERLAAFADLDRNQQMLRLSRLLKLKKLENTRASLKSALSPYENQRFSPEDIHRILSSISQINVEIKTLEKVDKP